jgi:hypothetical protein
MGMENMPNISLENIEKPTWHFTYYNNEISGHPVVFECDADDIAKADDLYELKIGKRPDKGNYIGYSAIKN